MFLQHDTSDHNVQYISQWNLKWLTVRNTEKTHSYNIHTPFMVLIHTVLNATMASL